MSRIHVRPRSASWPQTAAPAALPASSAPGYVAIVDVAAELDYWRAFYDAHALAQVFPPARFVDLEPAIRVGIHAFLLAPEGTFESLSQRLSLTYRRIRGTSCLSWYLAKAPCAEAYARLQHAVTRPALARPAQDTLGSDLAGATPRARARRIGSIPRPTLRTPPALPGEAPAPQRLHPPDLGMAGTHGDGPALHVDTAMSLAPADPRLAAQPDSLGTRH